jgi:hypothetical protein
MLQDQQLNDILKEKAELRHAKSGARDVLLGITVEGGAI